MNIKAIAFDYAGVIIGIPNSEFLKRITGILDMPEEVLLDEYYKINHRLNDEGISYQELYTDLLIQIGKEDKHDEVISFLNELFDQGGKVNKQIIDLVKNLKSQGYKTAILSNNIIKNAEHMREQFSQYFDAILVSHEIGARKPDLSAFEKLFTALNVLPEETIFIDDHRKSLTTAEEIGYHPIFYTGYDALIAELGKLGVTPTA